jgi:putative ubiquitin-RnfH superfamily antitoxin RatB of RatAB toxin-antitoxin module
VNETITVEVAWGDPRRQYLLEVQLEAGASVADAIEASGIKSRVEGLVVDPERVGIFGRRTTLDTTLRTGDRVEIYRPLLADPKEVRRARAAAEKK